MNFEFDDNKITWKIKQIEVNRIEQNGKWDFSLLYCDGKIYD